MRRAILAFAALSFASFTPFTIADDKLPLPGTEPLTMEGDLAAQMVEGVDKFLLRKLDESVAGREKHWKRDYSSAEAYEASLEPNRKRLAEILGVVDERAKFDAPQLVATTTQPALIGKGDNYEIFAVRWPVIRDVHAEGLLLVPTGKKLADVVAIPDATQTPEQLCGLAEGLPAESQCARRLAASGCRVLVPTTINREMHIRHPPERQGGAKLTNREFLYRPAFEMGRGLIGYEVQKILAAVDWLATNAGDGDAEIGVIGYGDGGMLALYAKALDTRINTAVVSGYISSRRKAWQEPIDRNAFGLSVRFGDAELMELAAKGLLVLEDSEVLAKDFPSEGGAPAIIETPLEPIWAVQHFAENFEVPLPQGADRDDPRVRHQPSKFGHNLVYQWTEKGEGFASDATLNSMIEGLTDGQIGRKSAIEFDGRAPEGLAKLDTVARHARQMHEIERDTQQLLAESPYVRAEFMNKLDTSSVEAYEKSAEEYREYFATKVIGRFDDLLLEPKPRSRKTYETDKWIGYEVVLDVYPDVFAYGLLLLPKDLKEGERRPVVVCQHGLEGRPQDVIGEQGSAAYSAFAGKLAERGFITFAPQNLYIGKDKFRTLQRKANPLGKTLFSVMVPQHQQICNWLSTLPMVDKDRIAFYGLSYGGKSAMRIPPLVPNYCLSICSADFNEWVWKNVSTRSPYSYVWTGEYEIFEWNLGHTFNYAEMAALIAPRPFMVERGMFDGVSSDEAVAYEFAKVRHLYEARLKLKDRCEIEFFDGPHKINGVQSYAFLHKHLKWPEPAAAE